MSDKLEDIGEFVLVIGDFHSPMRNLGLPDCFKELLKTDKIKHVLCTGNVGCNENLELLKNIADSVHITKGDMDSNFDFPEKINIKIGDFKISLVHGHQIIPWGKYFINPGSATGAFQPWVSNPIPSFILMAISKSSIVVYVYEEKDGKMNVEMSELRKQ
ncbi:vacuolar protein sorting-associated protein 29, putative [Plasmodium chabaudi adami]|uniref:Vacuolar protein sorting-associated protein 29 n=1 Tax=Plasmodium chabaudi adami TaxID=5826 RepID=A0A1C6XSA1_PLACE|nr:vacuolar protein sorting-associated protein 29, putative [Plasmodium chabaudi adami]